MAKLQSGLRAIELEGPTGPTPTPGPVGPNGPGEPGMRVKRVAPPKCNRCPPSP